MLPKFHFFTGLIFSIILFLIFPEINLIAALIIFLSSYLIDADHYLYYVFKKKDFSLKRAYKWFIEKHYKYKKSSVEERNKFSSIPLIFHGVEFLILLFILGFFVSEYFYFVLIGVSLHLFFDVLNEIRHRNRIDKISIIHDFLKSKKYIKL